MGKRDSYEPGTFCYVDLTTSDLEGAKRFYGEVFGWEYEDYDMGEGMTYAAARIDGADVAGIMAAEQPPHWSSYISVESVDDSVKQAQDAGAEVVQEPMDVPGSGRFAFVQDPSGALVGLWEAGELVGSALVNVHGALSWNDLQTHDVGKAVDFYTSVFGWEVAEVEGAPGDRVVIRVGEQMNGGIAQLPEEAGPDTPPHWMAYFAVDDLDAALTAVDGAGGERILGPLDIPAGTFAMVTDPQGAAFALFAGQLDD